MRSPLSLSAVAVARASALLAVAGLGACTPSVGSRASCAEADGGHADGEVPVDPLCANACDDDAARAVVYDAAGRAMYAGQAIVTGSCAGGGNFCHSETARDRWGVPGGLDFDAFPLSVAPMAADEEGLARLVRIQATIHRNRNAIWSTVVGGSMPPGAAGEQVVVNNHGWVNDPADVESDLPLATLDTEEGREILRNWLACGSPIVERWTPYLPVGCETNADCASGLCTGGECEAAGDVVPRIERPLDPTWRSIFAQVVEPNCTTQGCHAPDPGNGNAISAGLDLTDPAASLAALIDVEASIDETLGAECGHEGRIRVEPGVPEDSLFLHKLETEAPDCGDQMPFGQPLDAEQIEVIRAWIAHGACFECSVPDSAANAYRGCTNPGPSETCDASITCEDGFTDADGDEDNGCEAAE